MTSRALGWTFSVFSVVVMWQLRLESQLTKAAVSLGAKEGSELNSMIVDFGVPVILSALLLVFGWLYGRIWWRVLVSGNYVGGWWIYSLLAQTSQGARDTVGFFHVCHTQDDVRIDEAQAFWPLDTLLLRGKWRSNAVWLQPDKIRLIYGMKSERVFEGLPTDYEGYLELERSGRTPLIGRKVWEGCFNDLKHRGVIRGPVYAERLSRLSRHHIDSLKDTLSRNSAALLERVHESWPRLKAEVANGD